MYYKMSNIFNWKKLNLEFYFTTKPNGQSYSPTFLCNIYLDLFKSPYIGSRKPLPK